MITVFAAQLGMLSGAAAPLRPSSLFIALHAFSDDISGSYDELLDVSPLGADVRVRVTRISLANRYCNNLLVRAVEKIIPRTTVEQVAGASGCALAPSEVDSAIARARPSVVTTVTETASQTIVARCGAEERAFQFPWPERVDRQKLRRLAPTVDTLWRTYSRVEERAFGRAVHFDMESAARQKEMEALGDQAVAELVSGRYQSAFAGWPCSDQTGKDCHDNYLAWYLRGYSSAPARRTLQPPQLLDAARFRFTKYAPPTYPQIALTARLHGDVQLRLTVDPETGMVVRVEALSGAALLSQAAATAASAWQFDRGSVHGTVEVTLRFEMRCLE